MAITLDLVLTRRDCRPSRCAALPPGMLSDHSLVVAGRLRLLLHRGQPDVYGRGKN